MQQNADRRTEPRQLCPNHPAIEGAMYPRFGSFRAAVQDISARGMALQWNDAIPVGTALVLLLEPHGRLVRAQVAHSTPNGEGAWCLGCVLDDPLTDVELRAYLPRLWDV